MKTVSINFCVLDETDFKQFLKDDAIKLLASHIKESQFMSLDNKDNFIKLEYGILDDFDIEDFILMSKLDLKQYVRNVVYSNGYNKELAIEFFKKIECPLILFKK